MGAWYSEMEPSPARGLVNLWAPSHSSAAGLLHLDAVGQLWVSNADPSSTLAVIAKKKPAPCGLGFKLV